MLIVFINKHTFKTQVKIVKTIQQVLDDLGMLHLPHSIEVGKLIKKKELTQFQNDDCVVNIHFITID